MPWYAAQSPYEATVLANVAALGTHRTFKSNLRAALDAVIALGED